MKLSKNQIKEIIEKLLHISKSNNGVIPALNISEVSNIVAYLEGFPSWQHYLDYKSKEGRNFKGFFDLYFEKNNTNASSSSNLTIKLLPSIKFRERLLSNGFFEELTLKENKQIIAKIEIGSKVNSITKTREYHYLSLEDTAFIGENNLIGKKIKEQLASNTQTTIEFVDLDNGFSIDIINELFNTELFDVFFDSQEINQKDFMFIWPLIIKQIAKQFKIKYDIDIVLETLTLGFLVNTWATLSEDNNFLSSILINYFKSLGDININGNELNFSREALASHEKNIEKIYLMLVEIKEGYKKGIFSKNNKLIDFMINKQSVVVSVPKKDVFKHINIINSIIKFSVQKYNDIVKGKNAKEHIVFLLNEHKDLDKSFFNFKHVIMFNFLNVENYYTINNINQIIFSKHESFIKPNDNFLIDFYLNTISGENIFFNSGEKLLTLKEKNFYLWQQIENKKELFKLDY